MIDIVRRSISSTSEDDPPITLTDEQIISDKKSRNDRSSHARRKDKSIPKTFRHNKILTEMTTNKRTKCSNEDNKHENCFDSEYWSSGDYTDEPSCNFKTNHKSSDESASTITDTF